MPKSRSNKSGKVQVSGRNLFLSKDYYKDGEHEYRKEKADVEAAAPAQDEEEASMRKKIKKYKGE